MQSIVVSRGRKGASTRSFRAELEQLGGSWNETRGVWRIPVGETKEVCHQQLGLASRMEAAGLKVTLESE